MPLHPAYSDFNEKLLEFIFKTCEESGDINPVDQERYESFIGMSDREMSSVAYFAMRNEKLFEKMGTKVEDIYGNTKMILKMIALGIMAVRDDFKLVFLKPVGEPPDADTSKRIDRRIESFVPLFPLVLKRHMKSISDEN